jgi:hypothetical protein
MPDKQHNIYKNRGAPNLWVNWDEGSGGQTANSCGTFPATSALDRCALEEGARSRLVPLPAEVDRRMSHLRRGWYWADGSLHSACSDQQ